MRLGEPMLKTIKQKYYTLKLLEAVKNNNLEKVKKYLQKGADKNAKDNEGNTALILASINDYPEIVKLLIQAGADLTVRNNKGDTALIYAQRASKFGSHFKFSHLAVIKHFRNHEAQQRRVKQAALSCITFQQGTKSNECIVSDLPKDLLKEIYSYVLPSHLLSKENEDKKRIFFKNIFEVSDNPSAFINRRVPANQRSKEEIKTPSIRNK